MKTSIENPVYECTNLSEPELNSIYGGDLFDCNPSNCILSFVAAVYVGLIFDNIENPIGTSAGYPPR